MPTKTALRAALLATACLTFAFAADARPRKVAAPRPAATAVAKHWIASWATAPQQPDGNNVLPVEDLTDATVRQIVRTTVGGTRYRLRLSNRYGTQPLSLSVHIAKAVSPESPATVAGSDHAITFSGQELVTLPAGAEYLSDPIEARLDAFTDLAISLRYTAAPAVQTSHPGSRATVWLLHGDHAADEAFSDAKVTTPWQQMAAIEVETTARATLVAFGDSITDGRGVTTNKNERWTDVFARRAATKGLAVVNMGIGGNNLLNDGIAQNGLARFDRDALSIAGASGVIVFEGVNDLGRQTRLTDIDAKGHAALVTDIIAAYQQMIDRAHARGMKVYGATITPFVGSDYYHPNPAVEADRQLINAWIRQKGHFDGLIDFDAVVRDPNQPDRMLPDYDCGDHLHPSPAGYKAMGEAVDLSLF